MGLNQTEFGALIGVAKETIGNWETNERWPRNKAGKLKELGLDIKAIRDRPPSGPPRQETEGLYALGILLAVKSLREGDDPERVADLLEAMIKQRPAPGDTLPPLRNPNAV